MEEPALISEEYSLPPGERRRRLWKYFSAYKGLFAAGAFFLLLTNLLALAIPFYLGDAVQMLRDASTTEGTGLLAVRQEVTQAALIIIFLALGAGFVRIFSRITIFNAGRHIEFDIRNELYRKLADLSPRFFGSVSTGDVTSRVTNDVTYVRLLFAITYLHVINAVVAYAIAIQRMAGIDWALTLLCLAPYPILLYGVRNVIIALFTQTKVVQRELSNLSTQVQQNLSGIDVIKSYVLQDREIKAYQDRNDIFFTENMVLAKVRALLQALIVLIASSGTLVVLIVGSQRVINETMTLGAFVEFNAYVVALVFPTIAMGWVLSIWHRGLAAFDRVSEVLEYTPALDDPLQEGIPLPDQRKGRDVGEVRFENVSLSYKEGEKEALKNISLTIPPGSRVAIVGKTGSGKSSLARCIARLYDPQKGTIKVDGIPLRSLSLRELRSEIGFVPQEPFLFSMTIGQNIRFGVDALAYDPTIEKNPPSTALLDSARTVTQEERIQEAMEVAALAGEIQSFSQGLETLVGERGVTLSGGQKQRVTIARALLVDPRILILDDALASVDTETERKILDQLDIIMKGRTSIMITHRFNGLVNMDTIFVLREGELVESGTHQELLDADGYYAEMYQRQQLEEQLNE